MPPIWQTGAIVATALFTSNLALPTTIERQPIGQTRCFTPGENCTAFIVRRIAWAKSELLVQAYYLTSMPIVQAICEAKRRGVDVKLLLDKANEQPRYAETTGLLHQCSYVLIDDKVAIAHNKVMVIDRKHVITGSFNFTPSAQERNAENVLLIPDNPDAAEE
jgi:phosphatidylserine/phosphatidylglycerophosphate/cardiolipin synthase-like enzyme